MKENFSMENFEFNEFKPGDVVKGNVVSVTDKTIYVGIAGCFTEGTMHLNHYTNDKNITSFKGIIKEGDEIECEVAKCDENMILLSRLNQIKDENFRNVAKSEGLITVVIKSLASDKGYLCKAGSVDCFMPKSQATQSCTIGSKVEVKILESDEAKKKLVVSRRVVEQEIYQQNKQKEFDSINVNDVLKGTITKIEKYGALVKFNLVQGLLKTKEVAHEFVNINDLLHVGDEIEVKVIDKTDSKIELSRKALLKTPFELFMDGHKVSDKITGRVVNKLPYGILLEVANNVRGLLHSSEYSHNPNDNYQAYVKIGDEIEVAIIELDAKKERVSLSRKALIDNPWERVDSKVGDIVSCKVSEVKERGLQVEAIGVDGFIPFSECVTNGKNDLNAFYAIDDVVEAEIIDINPKEWKLRLSIRRPQEREERAHYEKYLNDEEEITSSLADQLMNLK